MRRVPIMLTVIALFASCAPADASPPPTSSPARRPMGGVAADLPPLLLTDDDGHVLTLGDGSAVASVEGIVAVDGRTIVPAAGAPEGLVPIVATAGGRRVAYAAPVGAAEPGAIAASRSRSRIVVTGGEAQRWDVTLDGNVVPEAFSAETEAWEPPQLYVVEYLPARAPDRYRVRLLDMASGQLSWPVNLRNKRVVVDTEMAGISRDQVVATSRGLLFTLYRGRHPGDDHDYAFVHTLSWFGGVWCLGVPDALGLDRAAGAVAVTPDESTLYVASAGGGVAAYDIDAILDPGRDPVASTVARTGPRGDARPALAVGAEGPVVAQGNRVVWLDASDLEVTATTIAAFDVEALTVAPDGRVFVAGDGRLQLVAPESSSNPVQLPAKTGTVTKLLPG